MQVFDCQSHVFPREYAELLTRNSGPVRARRIGDDYQIVYDDVVEFRLSPEVYDPRKKLADMDRAGVDVALLSINIPGPELLDAELRLEAAQCCNDYIADVVSRFSDRFVGLAVIPWQDEEAAGREMVRAVTQLGLRGVVLYSHLAGAPVDSPTFEPLLAAAAQDRIPVVLHPTYPVWSSTIRDYSMVPMLGMMVDTSIAMLRLILGGILERYPQLTIVHPHCGGVLPYLMPRVVEQTEVKGRGRERISRSPDQYYKRVYLDLVSPSTRAMQYAIDFAGLNHCLFGSDHPWVRIESLLECVAGLQLDPQDRDKILYRNACRVFSVAT